MDVTPWHNEEVGIATQVFGADWMPYGVSPTAGWSGLPGRTRRPGTARDPVPERELFPYDRTEQTAPMHYAESIT